MKHWLTSLLLMVLITASFRLVGHDSIAPEKLPMHSASDTLTVQDTCRLLYDRMHLEGRVCWQAFEQAMVGYQKIKGRTRNLLTLIDFSLPSTAQRLYVFDLDTPKLLYSSVVAHGRNSGENMATSFSNQSGSYKSSLGFYLTAETYHGSNGYSLRLDGLEKGINSNARERAIVMHGASYANPAVCTRGGRLGRSLGCPAVPVKEARRIIDAIKGGSVLFIYAENTDYLLRSAILS